VPLSRPPTSCSEAPPSQESFSLADHRYRAVIPTAWSLAILLTPQLCPSCDAQMKAMARKAIPRLGGEPGALTRKKPRVRFGGL
jgi:hypothetical protein